MMLWLRCAIGLLLGSILFLLVQRYCVLAAPFRTSEPVIFLEAPAIGGTESLLTSMGKASCSGVACHGNATAIVEKATNEPRWRSSYVQWESLDPHRDAYRSLETTWAKTILQHLSSPDQEKSSLDQYSPQTDQRCLACHTNPSLAFQHPKGVDLTSLRPLRAEGVSCEACHGNAAKWINQHTTWNSPENRREGHRQTDMVLMNDLGQRALACVGCHVGAPEDKQRGLPLRDMNHDMIAAGHPRLFFDYTTFVKRLPPHWAEKNRDIIPSPPRTNEEQAYAWFAGQLATAEAFLMLSSDRARRAQTSQNTQSVWPEFAEFKCYSCHKGLSGSTATAPGYQPDFAKRSSFSWALPFPTNDLRQLKSLHQDPALTKALQEMEQGKIPDSAHASAQFLQTAQLLRDYRAGLKKQPANWQQFLWETVNQSEVSRAAWDWEDYASRYYALMHLLESTAAISRLEPKARAQLDSKVVALGQAMRFPPYAADSKDVDAGPGRWDRRKASDCYQAVIDTLKQP